VHQGQQWLKGSPKHTLGAAPVGRSSPWRAQNEEKARVVVTVDFNGSGATRIGPAMSEEQRWPYVLIGAVKGARKGDAWVRIQCGGARGRSRHPFIGPGMANRAVREEGERQLVVELFNDFGYGELKWWGGLGSMRKRRRVRRWLISSACKAGAARCRARWWCGWKMAAAAALGDARKTMPRWARLGRKVERTGHTDGFTMEDFWKEWRWAARWFGPKTMKEEMGCENLIKGFWV
jgi:hypothetical protein